jgi:arylsulfatase A-like enzyme
MNRHWLYSILLLIGLAPSAFAAEPKAPNIVFMLADDQAWNGTSVAMHPDVPGSKNDVIQTPNLEKFAAQGMRFSAGYAPGAPPVCSPTRASLLTGKSPAQLHWTKAAPAEVGQKLIEPEIVKNLAAKEVSFAELLREGGNVGSLESELKDLRRLRKIDGRIK